MQIEVCAWTPCAPSGAFEDLTSLALVPTPSKTGPPTPPPNPLNWLGKARLGPSFQTISG